MYKAIILKSLVIASTAFCMYEGRGFYRDRESRGKTTPKIYDLSHKLLPDISEVPNIKIFANSIAFLPLLLKNEDKIEFFNYLIVILAIRAIFISSTILPKNKSCKDEIGVDTFIFGGCYDKMFSGHFAFVLLFSLIYSKYTADITGLVLLNILNAFIILTTRAHYTIDVLTSLFVTLFVFQNKLKI